MCPVLHAFHLSLSLHVCSCGNLMHATARQTCNCGQTHPHCLCSHPPTLAVSSLSAGAAATWGLRPARTRPLSAQPLSFGTGERPVRKSCREVPWRCGMMKHWQPPSRGPGSPCPGTCSTKAGHPGVNTLSGYPCDEVKDWVCVFGQVVRE